MNRNWPSICFISPETQLLLSLNDLKDVKGFIVSHVNIRSMFSKIDFLRYEMFALPVDILCIAETWLRPAIPDTMLSIPGYVLERLDRASQNEGVKKTGGGLVIYIKNSINYVIHHLLWAVTPHIETMTITIVPENARRMIIVLFYRPPNGKIADFLSHLGDIINELTDTRQNTDLILIGDANIDYLSESTDRDNLSDFLIYYELQMILPLVLVIGVLR